MGKARTGRRQRGKGVDQGREKATGELALSDTSGTQWGVRNLSSCSFRDLLSRGREAATTTLCAGVDQPGRWWCAGATASRMREGAGPVAAARRGAAAPPRPEQRPRWVLCRVRRHNGRGWRGVPAPTAPHTSPIPTTPERWFALCTPPPPEHHPIHTRCTLWHAPRRGRRPSLPPPMPPPLEPPAPPPLPSATAAAPRRIPPRAPPLPPSVRTCPLPQVVIKPDPSPLTLPPAQSGASRPAWPPASTC